MQCFRHFIDPPPDGTDVQTVPTVYAISLLLQVVQCEELIEFVATMGPTLYQAVAQWEFKSGINAELKGRSQLILDWLRPSIILKDKGVVELTRSLSTFALPTRERTHPSEVPFPAPSPPHTVTPPSTSTPATLGSTTPNQLAGIPSAIVPTTTPPDLLVPASSLPVISDTSDPAPTQQTPVTTQLPTSSPTAASVDHAVDSGRLRFTTYHLSTLVCPPYLLLGIFRPTAAYD